MNDLQTCPACRRREGIPAPDGYFVCMTCRFRWQWLDAARRQYAGGPDGGQTWATVRASGSMHDGVRLIDVGD